MNKIGFKNFRKFGDYTEIEYGNITYLVGRNNSGKSTVVKALMLIYEYLKSGDIYNFSFANNVLENVNIVTYERAKNIKSIGNDLIEFRHTFGIFEIQIVISGKEGETVAQVHQLSIKILDKGYEFRVEPQLKNAMITVFDVGPNIDEEQQDELIKNYEREIKRLKKEINDDNARNNLLEGLPIFNSSFLELTELKNKLTRLKAAIKKNKSKPNININSHYEYPVNFKYIFNGLIHGKMNEYEKQFNDIQKAKIKGTNPEFVNLRVLKENLTEIEECGDLIEKYLINPTLNKYAYLPANSIKQSALLNIRDKLNTLAQAVHNYYQMKTMPGEREYMFVEEWMKKFEVGDAFRITLRAGEAYEVEITSNGVTTPLVDLGMGSIQAMMMIFTFAYFRNKYIIEYRGEEMERSGLSQRDVASRPVFLVIIEEPEINLHPALQSKLADFFYESGLDVLVETHSEYIIRRTQVIHANDMRSAHYPDPIDYSVIYFPKNNLPYNMEYNDDGTFKKNFGEGFFDAASASTLELIRIRREREN